MITRRWQVNQAWHTVRIEPLTPLLHVLREELGITSPKEGCGEGECGTCTVLLDGNPVTACLVAAGSVHDGSRIQTAEEISESQLGEIVVDCFVQQGAVQCGICFPGMLISTYAFLRDNPEPTEQAVREAISGNLCRCTGYTKIISAILSAGEQARELGIRARAGTDNASGPLDASGNNLGSARVPRASDLPGDDRSGMDKDAAGGMGGPAVEFRAPESLSEALAIRSDTPGCRILAGGTDFIVARQAAQNEPLLAGTSRPESPQEDHHKLVLSLGRIAELHEVQTEGDNLLIGTATTVEEIAHHPVVIHSAPALSHAARMLGSRQIRHLATIGGNIVNASPAADLVPPLLVTGATLILASRREHREIPLAEFFEGYKRLDLRPDELLVQIKIPKMGADERESYRKLGTRRAQSIAKVCAAARLLILNRKISKAAIALGSVAPTAVRLPETEARLLGRTPSDEILGRIRGWVAEEITPITDVRSTEQYRRVTAGVLVADLIEELGGG